MDKREATKRRNAIREVLWRHDPVGIGDVDRAHAASEYDALAGRLASALLRGATASHLTNVVSSILADDFGLHPNPDLAAEMARDAMSAWKDTLRDG